MGRRGFRLSDIMPNAWFYKLKDMNKIHTHTKSNPTKNTSGSGQKQSLIPNRASYYFPSNSPIHPKAFDTHFPLDSPRKSSTRKPPRRKPAIVTSPRVASSSSISSSYRSSASLSVVSVSESESERSYCIAAKAPPPADIVLELRPIITKKPPAAAAAAAAAVHPPIQRLRARANSPRVSAARKVRAVRKKRGGISESFAVVKSSADPKRDFRESMMEMIAENGLSSSKELEELLACYLSLNSNEYHDVIVKVFEEIWFDITRSVKKQ